MLLRETNKNPMIPKIPLVLVQDTALRLFTTSNLIWLPFLIKISNPLVKSGLIYESVLRNNQ